MTNPHNAPEYWATNYRGAALYQNQPAITAGNVIIASSTAPLEFAYHIFKTLDLYDAQILEAWYGLLRRVMPRYVTETSNPINS